MRGAVSLAWILACCAASLTHSATAQTVDDALGGFDDAPAVTTATPAATTETKKPATEDATDDTTHDLTGSIVAGASWNYIDHNAPASGTDWQGLSKMRTRLNLQYDHTFDENWKTRVSGYTFHDWMYNLRDEQDYTNAVRNDYETESEIQEMWVQGRVREDLDIRVGRQVVNWGRSDSLRVLDILNPLDNREPGLADIEDIRLPVTMLKADYYAAPWTLSLIAIPEVRFSKNPPYGSDFSTLTDPALGAAGVLHEHKPENIDNTAWAAALTGIFSGWDLSLHAAHYWVDQPYLAPAIFTGSPFTTLLQSELRHSEATMLGAGGNITQGSWLYKWEAAWQHNLDYTTSSPVTFMLPPPAPPFPVTTDFPTGVVQKNRGDVMLGTEYYGFADTAIALEVVNRHIQDFQNDMKQLYARRDSMETSLRYTRKLWNDQLELSALGLAFGERAQNGSLIRLEAKYEIMDGLNVRAGIVTYQKGDLPPFDTYYKNDRLFAEVKYSF